MALNVGLLRRLRLPGESARATGPRPIRADGTLICSHLQKGEAWTCGIVPPVCPTSEAAAVLGGTAMERGYLSSVPTPTCRPSSGVPDFALDGDRDRWPAETLALGAGLAIGYCGLVLHDGRHTLVVTASSPIKSGAKSGGAPANRRCRSELCLKMSHLNEGP